MSFLPLTLALSPKKGRGETTFDNTTINIRRDSMNGVSRSITYFNQVGVENTDDLVEIVHQRVKEGDIRSVVVASDSGKTGLKFAK